MAIMKNTQAANVKYGYILLLLIDHLTCKRKCKFHWRTGEALRFYTRPPEKQDGRCFYEIGKGERTLRIRVWSRGDYNITVAWAGGLDSDE